MLGVYATATVERNGAKENAFHLTTLDQLVEGKNVGKVILGRVVGSIHNENSVPL